MDRKFWLRLLIGKKERLGASFGTMCRFLWIDRYLVDPASSYMLVLKIKPCMSKYKPPWGETADGSLNRLESTRECNLNG